MTAAVLDAHRMVKRLRDAGFSDAKAGMFLRLVAEAEAGRLDHQAVRDQVLTAKLTPLQAALLIGELLQRLARRTGGAP